MSNIKAFAGETLIYGFANVFSRIFAMFLIPLYVHFLGKIEYSNLIMLQSLFTLLTFLLALNSGVFYYFYENEDERYRQGVFTSWFYYQIVVALVILSLLFLFGSNLRNVLILTETNGPALIGALILIGLQLIPYIFNITNINLFRVKRQPKSVLKITFLESLFTLMFVGLGCVYFEFGIFEIFAAQIAARSLVAIIYLKHSIFFLRWSRFSIKMLQHLVAFAWPFFIISSFSWAIISIDKFIGANALQNKEDVALLALAMQLTIPIAVLADMIRMAIGPYVMSIRKEEDADKSYQQIFNVSVFSSSAILILLLMIAPFAVLLLADDSYMEVLNVIPLIGFASILSLMYNQLAISFSLSKKNVYIMYASVAGGLIGYSINHFYMADFGYVVSGVSQIMAYGIMVILLYFIGKKITNRSLSVVASLSMLGLILGFFILIYSMMAEILDGNYFILILAGITAFVLLGLIFLHFQHLSARQLIEKMRKALPINR